MTRDEASKALGVSRVTIWRHARRLKLRVRKASRGSPRRDKIIAAIASGIETSRALCSMFSMTRPQMTVELSRLYGLGIIAQRGSAPTKKGRPCLRWRVVRAA